jgi:hypothetical protein
MLKTQDVFTGATLRYTGGLIHIPGTVEVTDLFTIRRAMSHAVSNRLLTADAEVRSWTSSWGIYGEQNGSIIT